MNQYSLLQAPQRPPLLGGGNASADISNLTQSSSPGGAPPAGPGTPPGMPPVANQIPSSPQIPPQSAPPLPPPPPQHPHQNLLGRVHDALINSVLGGASNGYEDFLTPQQIESTKPGLLGALFHGEGTAASIQQAKLDHLVELKQASVAMQRQQQILKARNDFATQYPPPMTGSEDDMSRWANRAIPFFTAHGDMETVKSLMPLAEKFAETHAGAKPPAVQQAQTGDTVTTFDPAGHPNAPFFDPTTNTWVRGIQRGVPKAKLVEDEQNRQLRALAIANGQSEAQIHHAELLRSSFASQNKGLTDASMLYAPAKAAIAQARAGNPGALKPALTNYIASVDAKARMTMGTMNFLKQVDPSFKGNLQAWLAQKTTGTLPPEQLDMMEKMVDAINKAHADTYEQRRAGLISRSHNPLAESYIPPTEEIFGTGSQTPPAAPATGANKVRALMSKP